MSKTSVRRRGSAVHQEEPAEDKVVASEAAVDPVSGGQGMLVLLEELLKLLVVFIHEDFVVLEIGLMLLHIPESDSAGSLQGQGHDRSLAIGGLRGELGHGELEVNRIVFPAALVLTIRGRAVATPVAILAFTLGGGFLIATESGRCLDIGIAQLGLE